MGRILFTMDPWNRTCNDPLFLFEAKWLLHDSLCSYFVKLIKGSRAYQLVGKIEINRKIIKLWKKQFVNILFIK